ncbi:MAG: VOC family protein [Candidatus Thorarchaeota archaeon]|jgi:catechol 2,3-dioxygenase-like lactoylglutathione lyase family enzyme
MKPSTARITRLWLAMIEVSNLDKAIEFYHNILGLPIALDARLFNHVEVGPREPLAKLGLHASKDRGNDRKRTGVVFDTDNIYELCSRLKQQGVVFTQEPNKMPWGSISASFLDPDNNELEVVQDPEHYTRKYSDSI